MQRLSPKQAFCLKYLANVPNATAYDVARAAKEAGINKTRYGDEWAHAPLRELRKRGFVVQFMRPQPLFEGWTQSLTDEGRALVKELGDEM